jgi:hypothetical protein
LSQIVVVLMLRSRVPIGIGRMLVLRCAKRGFAADARARRRCVRVPYDICACTLSMSFLRMHFCRGAPHIISATEPWLWLQYLLGQP